MQKHDANWINYLISSGFPDAKPLATGMEGAVYHLGHGKIAKVWADQSSEKLERLSALYDDIASSKPPFNTPKILDTRQAQGRFITIELELTGKQLREDVAGGEKQLSSTEVGCFLEVLSGLARVEATAAMKNLAVLDEQKALWEGHDNWGTALSALIQRRATRYGNQLKRAVPDFDAILARIIDQVEHLNSASLTLIHGDIAPVNILVDGSSRPISVLDFGFLSTAGDPAFDAAVGCAIFNMYGPHSRQIEDQLTQAVTGKFGYTPKTLSLYKAAYAAITSNAYDPNGNDGHFEWCTKVLSRQDF